MLGGTTVPRGRPGKIPPACAPSGDAPWRCRLVPSSRTVPKHGHVLARPSTSAAPDRRCAMCPRRPSCPRLTARRATPPTPQPSHPGWGRARAWRSLRRGRWIARPFAGSPPPNTATGLACDHRAAFTHAGPAMASRARRLVRRRRGHHYPQPVVSPGLALPGRYRAGGAGLGQPPPAGRGRRPRRCGPGRARYQPAQPADTPPDRRLHGRTEAQALGDADLCYTFFPASDGLRHIRRRRQAAGLPAVPGRS